ncbi:LutC/YkgG family protein [Paenibacillus lemnae]|uniref:LUD domain-containing protein n=1 Tax=Paenibacillus lemnae TaxID=1330551 RepID=A0A848MBD0_PAELE|nr:LUD domain-containing protein [Paenibacillus lemnae]NMO97816.1 LUD domain-containing protein [Paenibacillus lemnae]
MSSDSHEAWLAELEAASRQKQETFMNGIASKLRRPRVTNRPDQPFRGAPDFWESFQWSSEERISMFTQNFQAAGGHVIHVADAVQAADFITNKAEEMKAARLLMQNQPSLLALDLQQRLSQAEISVWNDQPETDWRAKAAEADFGIVEADYAAAYTGSMTVMSSANKGRSVSLLPTVLIAIIPVDRLKTRLGEIMSDFDAAGREGLPAGIHFISGPSRSADIENDLTIGVHGPGIVYAVLVDSW